MRLSIAPKAKYIHTSTPPATEIHLFYLPTTTPNPIVLNKENIRHYYFCNYYYYYYCCCCYGCCMNAVYICYVNLIIWVTTLQWTGQFKCIWDLFQEVPLQSLIAINVFSFLFFSLYATSYKKDISFPTSSFNADGTR